MTKLERRQERIDQILHPYRKTTMALKAVRWEMESYFYKSKTQEEPCSITTTIS